MDKTKTIAIVAVVIIVVAACAAVGLNLGKNKSDSSSFTIVDGKGTEFKFDGPIDGVVSVNTNIPKAMKILGYEDQLKGISFYGADTDAKNWEEFSPLFPNSQHMSVTASMTGEEIKKLGVDYVIAPVSSMTVKADAEAEYNNLGIKVIRLDCNGDNFLEEDFQKLITLFSGKDAKNEKYDAFEKMYNDVINTVLDKAKGTDFSDKTFLSYFSSMNKFYNQTAVISKNIEKLYGQNALRSIPDLDLSGVTNSAKDDGVREKVIETDANAPIDKIFFRGGSSTKPVVDASSAESAWSGSILCQNYSSLSAITAGEVYVFNSDVMSGPLSFVAFVMYAEICGIDTGYDVADLVEEYNKAYGFNELTTGLLFQIVDGEATEFVIE